MRSNSRIASALLRVVFGISPSICLSAIALCSALAPALVPAVLHAQGTKPGATPMIGGNAIVTVYPETDNVVVSGSSTHTYSFSLGNSGTANAVAALSIIECTGAVSSCSVSPSSVSLVKNGGSGTATVTYHTAATGTGELILYVNWGSGNNTSATLDVAMQSATPSVTASPTVWTAESVSTNDPGFTITNNGNTAATYTLTASCTGNLNSYACSASPSTTVSVTPHGSTTATLNFQTGAYGGGNGTIQLTAQSPFGETGSAPVTIVIMSEKDSVGTQTAPTPPNPNGSATYGFTVNATGNNTSSVTYSLVASCSGALSCSTTPSPSSVSITPSSPGTASVTATAGSNPAGGSGTVTLSATFTDSWGHVYTSQNSYTVTVPDIRTAAVQVTPDDSTTYNEANVSTNYVFKVHNAGNVAAQYILSATCTGTVGNTCTSRYGSITIQPNDTAFDAPVDFTTLGVGQNASVSLHATVTATWGPIYADDGSVQVVTLAPTVQVIPVNSSTQALSNSSGTFRFWVRNQGTSGQITYTLQVTGCTAPLTSCSAPASVTVAQGADSIVNVSFQTQGTTGDGQISLRAYKTLVNTYESTGTGTVDVSTRLSVSTDFMNNDDQDMSLCVASCFAMTASRSTVPYYTLDTPRSVTLAYNSDRAFPRPFVYADVSVASAPASVSSYTLEVKRLGAHLLFTNGDSILTFAGTSTPGTTYRLAGQIDMSSYGTMIDTVTLFVTAHYTNGESDVTPVKTQFMLINDQSSPIGKGWAIAGLQQLSYESEGGGGASGYMARNGDGSATYFATVGATAADFSTLTLSGSVWTRTYLDGSRVLFNANGLMTAAIDRLGRETTFQYGGSDGIHLQTITEPMRSSGNSTSAPYLSLAYDGNGKLSGITETGGTNGRTTSVTVDANGYLTRITDPDGGYDSYGYDGSGRLHTITDRRGNTTTYSYDTAWKLSQVSSPSIQIDAGGGSTTAGTPTTNLSSWQAAGVPFITTVGSPAPLTLPSNVRATIVDPVHDTTAMYPNRWGEPVKNIDALGNVTTIQYQGFLPTVVTHPDASVDSATYIGGLLFNQRKAGQETINYSYGSKNQLVGTSGAGVVTVSNTLDSLGRVTKTQYGTVAGDTTVFTYDPVTKNVASTTQPSVGLTTYQYDAQFGNLAVETDPGSRVTQSYFDSYGRGIALKTPQYPMATTQYDVINRVTSEHNGYSADSVRIKYDAILPVSVRDPLSHVDSTEYDAVGNVTRHFGYASGAVATTMRYDLAGRPTSVTNRRGQRIDVTYDPLGRVLSKTDGSATDQFTYSANGLIQTAANATSSVRMVSAPKLLLDTVQTTILASGVTQHTYTVVHRASSQGGGTDSTTISSDGAPAQFVTRRFVQDATNGTLSAINLGTLLGHLNQGTFTSDDAGWRTGTSWPSAGRTSVFLSTGTHMYETYGSYLDPSFYAGYRVDSAGRILRDHRQDGSTTTYTNRVFGYDDLGRYTGTTTLSDTQYPWSCGGSGRLDPDYGYIGCAIDSVPRPYVYGYDDAENRTGGGIHYGVGDQVTSSDGFSYTYDADGNVATRTQTSTGIVLTYSWSADNRLLSASKNDGTSVSFDYDALGNPVVKRGSTGQVTRVTLYDGSQILADLDQSGTRQAEYIYDAGTDAPFAMVYGQTAVAGVRYYAQDDFGNVQGQFSDSGAVTETVTYGDWGLPTITGGVTNRLTWKGLSYDPDVGLTYMRARWYDPNIGRFVSEDPLGLEGGINPYVFANNDPINGQDPSGMMIDFGDDDNNDFLHPRGGDSCQGKSLVNYNPNTGIISSVIYSWQECIPTPAPISINGTSGGGGGTTPKPKPKPAPVTTKACFANNRFSSLFPAGSWRTAAQYAEVVPPLAVAGQLAVRGSTQAAEHQAESILVNRVIPRLTTGVFTKFGVAVVKFEDVPMYAVAGFTVGYNAATWAQCALGVIK